MVQTGDRVRLITSPRYEAVVHDIYECCGVLGAELDCDLSDGERCGRWWPLNELETV